MSTLSQRLARLQQQLDARRKVTVITFAPMPGEGAARTPEPVLLGGSPAARARVLAQLAEERARELAQGDAVDDGTFEHDQSGTADTDNAATEAAPLPAASEAPDTLRPRRGAGVELRGPQTLLVALVKALDTGAVRVPGGGSDRELRGVQKPPLVRAS